MKSINTRFNLIVGHAALALFSLCFLQTQAPGQALTEYALMMSCVGRVVNCC